MPQGGCFGFNGFRIAGLGALQYNSPETLVSLQAFPATVATHRAVFVATSVFLERLVAATFSA